MQLVMRRIGRGLYPSDGVAEKEVYRLPGGVDLKVQATSPRRSLPQLRLYWAILQLIADNSPRRSSKEALHAWVKRRLGIVDDVVLRSGEIIEVPGSIALEAMEEPQFNQFFDKAMKVICAELTAIGAEDLVREAQAFLDRPDGDQQ